MTNGILDSGQKIITDSLVYNSDIAQLRSYPKTGTSLYDLTENSNTGTLVNGVAFNTGSGGYLTCDGLNDYIQIPNIPILKFGSSNFTIEYWFRKLGPTTIGFNNIWGLNAWNSGDSPGTNEWSLNIGNGATGTGNNFRFSVEVGNTAYSSAQSTTVLSLNTWHQLVAVREGGNLKTYLNAVLEANTNPAGFTSSSVINNVAARSIRANLSGANAYFTKADNSQIRIYKKALSQTEILQNYNATRSRYGQPTIISGSSLNYDISDPVCYPGTGTAVTDLSGNNNSATTVGGVTFTTENGGALVLNGTTAYINASNVVNPGTTSYTINMWAKMTSLTGTRPFLSKGNQSSTTSGISIFYSSAGGGTLNVRCTSSTLNQFAQRTIPFTNISNYVQITMVIDRTTNLLKGYLNGSDLGWSGTSNITGFASIATATSLFLGAIGSPTILNYFQGNIAQTQAYRRALSDAEILENFNNNKAQYGL